MCYYYKLGDIPHKRHTQFRQPDGSLYKEEVVSSKGFSGIYSILYHKNPPTQVKQVQEPAPFGFTLAHQYPLKHTHLKTSIVEATGEDYLESRKTLMANHDVSLSICNPTGKSMDYFYKNGESDEVLFIHDGSGELISQFGLLRFEQGDYIVIPRTTIYKIRFDEATVRMLIIESTGPIETVKRYRNELGQLLEHSPYCERDIRPPSELNVDDTKGEYLVKIKKGGYLCMSSVRWMW
jgi:homogentisate 1,2-dioxygenase